MVACHGYSSEKVQYGDRVFDVTRLHTLGRAGKGWFSQRVPHNGQVTWTIRAMTCTGTTEAGNTSCDNCVVVPKLESFRASIRRAQSKTPISADAKHELVLTELKTTKKQLNTVLRQVARTQKQSNTECAGANIAALVAGKRGGVEELETLVKCLGRIDANSIRQNQQTGYEFATLILKILFVSGKGRRYTARTKTLLAYTRSLGGGRLYNVLSSTLGLACERSARGWMYDLPPFEYGESAPNVYHAGQIYGVIKRHLGIRGDVVAAIVEDESAVVDKPDWDATTNRIVGFCGVDCTNKCPTLAACRAAGSCPQVHQCDWKHGQGELVPDEPGSYNGMLSSLKTMRAANNVRILVICPMHDRLPHIPIALFGVCLSFTGEQYIRPQWNRFNELYDVHVKPILGYLLYSTCRVHGSNGLGKVTDVTSLSPQVAHEHRYFPVLTSRCVSPSSLEPYVSLCFLMKP